MKTNLYFSLIIILTFGFGSCRNEHEIFVSAKGNNDNSGTKELPVLTVQEALKRARNLNGDLNITILGGTYKLDETLVLNHNDQRQNSKLVIRAQEGDVVSFTGGLSIAPDKVEILSDQEKNLFPSSVQKHIRKINLKKLGIINYGTIKNVGFARPYAIAPMELFINKTAYQLSRYPNNSSIAMGKILDEGSIPAKGDDSNRGGKFTYKDERLSTWKQSSDVWICGYFMRGWAEDAIQVANIDIKNKTLTTAQPHHYGFGTGEAWKQWYAFNVLEEIDSIGEYYIDRQQGKLFFYQHPEQENIDIELSLFEDPLLALENVSNVTIKNITFECSRGMGIYIETGNNNTIEGCTIRNLGGVGICLGKGVKPDHQLKHDLERGEIVSRELGSLNQYIYNNSTFYREAGTNHLIKDCHIYQLGAGGIVLGGGNRKTLEEGNNVVENCLIYDFNRIEKSYRPGVWITGVGNRIANCEIFNAPMMAIWLHGNEHVIEKCDFHDVVREMHDQGAIYYGRNPSERGNVVRQNYFHHLGNEHLSVAVYHDDGACDMQVYDNVFYKSGSMPVLIGGGNDHTYTNNIFIDVPIGIHVDNRKQGWAKGFGEKGGAWRFEERLEAVNYLQAPYSEQYPQLLDYWQLNEEAKHPKNNSVYGNIFFRVTKLLDGDERWLDWKNNAVRLDTPPFWNETKGAFNLKDGYIVYEDLEGFKPINFEEIGCRLKLTSY